MSLLEVRGLVKRFAVGHGRELTAVNKVSFAVEEGETLAIVGESGSGKTTVARCILGLLAPSSGEILLNGIDIARLSRNGRDRVTVRRMMQGVFQDPYDSMDPRMTLGAVIEEPLRFLNRLNARQRWERVEELLGQVKLSKDVARLVPRNLTSGELQRAAIARALAPEPSFLVLDEPTASLDPIAREETIGLLRQVQLSKGTAFLFISHDLITVRHISHSVAVMYLGEVVEEGPTSQVFDDPRHPYTRALLASAPSLERRLYGDVELTGEIPSPIDLPRGCFLASRCPFVLDGCRLTHPQLEAVDDGRTSRCLRATGHLPSLPSASIDGRECDVG